MWIRTGAAGVGKTALVSQFMTSEYMNTYDASLGKMDVSIQFLLLELNRFSSIVKDKDVIEYRLSYNFLTFPISTLGLRILQSAEENNPHVGNPNLLVD